MERIDAQEIFNIENIFGRLMDRQMFPWQNERKTIREAITKTSRTEANRKLTLLKQNTIISSYQIIEKIKGRAKTWNYTKFLDHLSLWEIFPQRNS